MRAIISVYDKTGIVEFAKELSELGIEIVSSGGTYDLLKSHHIPVIAVPDVTGFPECLDGRVKTLHPRIHGGILANRSLPEHIDTLKNLEITPVDLVVVNLYPFSEVISKPDHTLSQAIENIDIGGPSMIRAAAKNYQHVLVLTDQRDYASVLTRLKNKNIDDEFRLGLSVKAFEHTARYDAMIFNYLNKKQADANEYPDSMILTLSKKQSLRYGENPHQSASYYSFDTGFKGIEQAQFLQGKELSYNNINDAQSALNLALEFDEPVCVAVKHSTPCGVAMGHNIETAFDKAYESDPVSIFGGIICINRTLDGATATKMSEIFLEVIIAPDYSPEALTILSKKKNLRLLALDSLGKKQPQQQALEFKSVGGGMLIQETDSSATEEKSDIVTKQQPNNEQMQDLVFAMKIAKHVKSNAIVVVKAGQTLGIGGGEVSRIWAAEAALARAGENAKGAVIGSDAFFPFPDVVELCAEHQIAAIIQPGGSLKDNLSVEACDKHNIAMVFTGVRHFKH